MEWYEMPLFKNLSMSEKSPKVYSKDLMKELFRFPYIKRNQLEKAGLGNLKIAGNYLKELEAEVYLKSEQIGKEKLYLNFRFFFLIDKKLFPSFLVPLLPAVAVTFSTSISKSAYSLLIPACNWLCFNV